MTERCEQPGCAMRAGHAGDWHAGELENAVIAMPRPEPSTPLPWYVLDEGDAGYIAHITESGFSTLVASMESQEQDADYIVYAANKLPELEADRARLVAMLERLLAGALVEHVGDIEDDAELGLAEPVGIASDCSTSAHGVEDIPDCTECARAVVEYNDVRAVRALLAELKEGTDD